MAKTKEPIFRITFDETPCTKEQEIELQAKLVLALWYFDLEAKGKKPPFELPGYREFIENDRKVRGKHKGSSKTRT